MLRLAKLPNRVESVDHPPESSTAVQSTNHVECADVVEWIELTILLTLELVASNYTCKFVHILVSLLRDLGSSEKWVNLGRGKGSVTAKTLVTSLQGNTLIGQQSELSEVVPWGPACSAREGALRDKYTFLQQGAVDTFAKAREDLCQSILIWGSNCNLLITNETTTTITTTTGNKSTEPQVNSVISWGFGVILISLLKNRNIIYKTCFVYNIK